MSTLLSFLFLFRQTGVVRTNCMDCLDRTNVVQSLLAAEFLQDALARMGVLTEGQRLAQQEPFQVVFGLKNDDFLKY